MFTLKIGTLVLCFCLNDHLNLVKRLFNHAFSLRSVEKNNNHQRWFQTFPLDLLKALGEYPWKKKAMLEKALSL